MCFAVNGITEEADPTIYSGKVIRPLRSVDPTQTEYQGMIEIVDEGKRVSLRWFEICPNSDEHFEDLKIQRFLLQLFSDPLKT